MKISLNDKFDNGGFKGKLTIRYTKGTSPDFKKLSEELNACVNNKRCRLFFHSVPDVNHRIIGFIFPTDAGEENHEDADEELQGAYNIIQRHGCYMTGKLLYHDGYMHLDSVGYFEFSRLGGMKKYTALERCAELEAENEVLKAKIEAVSTLHATTPIKIAAINIAINATRNCANTLRLGDDVDDEVQEHVSKKRKVY